MLVGQYTEMIFPSYGVRFIAVNNNVDSLYGDKKDENDPKRKIVPDEDAAPVVRSIFSLCAEGKDHTQIAKQLKSEQVPSPGYYYYSKTGVLLTNVDVTKPYAWNNTTVANILEDEVYLGHTISLQSTTISYKNKKRIELPKSEQLRFENTHEQFRMLSADYNSEQNSLKDRIPQTVERIERLQASISNVSRFRDKAKRYIEINELTGELLNLFIERIEVGEREERYSRTAELTIINRYRDIGVLGAFTEEAEKSAG